MSRWLVLTVLSIAPFAFGCASSVRPGLANAPRLGGTSTADDRITDVVSNGDDACGLYAENGVLPNRIPPCASWMPSRSPASYAAPVSASPRVTFVEPWLNHFYVGWPCPAPSSSSPTHQARLTKSAWTPPSTTVATCSVP